MADLSVIVDPDNGAGTDYTSLSAAEAGEQTDLVTATDTLTFLCRASSGSADTTAVTFSGWTVNATYHPRIEGDSGYRATMPYSSSAYRIEPFHADCINVSINYLDIDGIQCAMELDYASARVAIRITGITGTAVINISNCVIKEITSLAYFGISGGYTGGSHNFTLNIWNTVVYDFDGSSGRAISIDGDTDWTFNCYNCTVQNCTTGYHNDGGTFNAYNCGAANCTTAFSSVTQSYCSSTTPTFENAATDDFHLDAADTTWLGQGTDDPGSGLYSDDIDGDTRPTGWSIGADDSAGSSPTSLTVAALQHGHTLASITPGQLHNLAIQAMQHGHTLDVSTVGQLHNLFVSALQHGHSLDSVIVNISSAIALTVQSLQHGHSLDGGINLGQLHNLSIAALQHGHTLDPVTIGQFHNLIVEALQHGHTLESVTVNAAGIIALTVQALQHGHTLDQLSIGQFHDLLVAALQHGHSLDSTTVGESVISVALTVASLQHLHTLDASYISGVLHVLTVDGLLHSHVIDGLDLFQFHNLLVESLQHGHSVESLTLNLTSATGSVTLNVDFVQGSLTIEVIGGSIDAEFI